jgi:hypothetical protein
MVEAEKQAVQAFATSREAKEFLVDRILSQANRDGIALSEVEKKMLYFSETAWTLPDIANASAEFDRDYNQDEYEAKIAKLVRSIRREQAQYEVDEDHWEDAVSLLRKEDHYLLAIIDLSNLRDLKIAPRPPGDFVKLILTALLIVAGILGAIFLLK